MNYLDRMAVAVQNFFAAYLDNLEELTIDSLKELMEPIFIREGYRENTVGTVENILVIRPDEIGDNVLFSGFLRELRRCKPLAHITLIVNPTVYNLVELCPYVNEIFPFDDGDDLDLRLTRSLKICRERLWQRKFQTALLPRFGIDRYFAWGLAYFSGAAERIGFDETIHAQERGRPPYNNAWLTRTITCPPAMLHEAARDYYFLSALGMKPQREESEVWYDSQDVQRVAWAAEHLGGRKLVAVTVGANHPRKIYPADLLAAALGEIAARGCGFLLIGGKNDRAAAEYVEKRLPPGAAVNLAGETTLREAAAAISLTSLYVGNDTGPLHIAAALGKPVISIQREPLTLPLTPLNDPAKFAPWHTRAKILRPAQPLPPCTEDCEALEPHCIKTIPPSAIVAAYDELTEENEIGC